MRKVILTAEILLLFLMFSSCSENPPEIEQLFWQSNRINDLEQKIIYDTLSVFIQVTDEDGIEDIETLYIINDKEELFWKTENVNLVIKENKDLTWIGSSRLKMNDYSMFPSGEYRVMVIDEAGERMETSFILKNSGVMAEEDDFPSLKISGNNFTADNKTDVLWMYDSEGNLISENYTDGKYKTFPSADKTSEIFVYRFDKINGTGLITGPYKIR